MTSPVSAASGRSNRSPQQTNLRRSGFTLIEMLVVVGIILLLISLVVAVVFRAQKAAGRARTKSDLQAVSAALEQYRSDFNTYPAVPPNAKGSWMLGRWLIGPGSRAEDGEDGPGFRLVQGGKVYPAYLAAETFKVQRAGSGWQLLDHEGHPIEYYPKRNSNVNTLVGPLLHPTGMYNPTDGDVPQDILMRLVGDDNRNNKIDKAPTVPKDLEETLKFSGPFILASPGTDGVYGKEKDDVFNVE